MYAIIKTGGKQYKVEQGDVLKLELLSMEVGEEVCFDQVLMIATDESVSCGSPYVVNAVVQAEILSHGRHKKIKIVKFRRRKHYMRHMGHRQGYTEVKILSIAS